MSFWYFYLSSFAVLSTKWNYWTTFLYIFTAANIEEHKFANLNNFIKYIASKNRLKYSEMKLSDKNVSAISLLSLYLWLLQCYLSVRQIIVAKWLACVGFLKYCNFFFYSVNKYPICYLIRVFATFLHLFIGVSLYGDYTVRNFDL